MPTTSTPCQPPLPVSRRARKLTLTQFCFHVLFRRPLTNAERQARHRAKRRLQPT